MSPRVDPDELERILREEISHPGPALPAALEAQLFARAEEILAPRRVMHERALGAQAQARARAALPLAERLAQTQLARALRRLERWFVFSPQPAAALGTLAVLVVALTQLLPLGGRSAPKLTYSDLPPIPQFNDASARYEAQWHAEREAYQREVRHAQDSVSGGI